jgi:1-acyl-sn-glycerol-3-phosphate acyltransferase
VISSLDRAVTVTDSHVSRASREKKTDLIDAGKDMLTPVERFHIRVARRTIEPGAIDRAMRFCQRTIGARWINASLTNLRHVIGRERLPRLDADESFLCVANHRSFFDLYVVSALLVSEGMPHRLLFPVRSNFHYDSPLGVFVNGAMSFFSMYPPIFRDRQRAALNVVGLDEIARILNRGGAFVGVHPEGTRNKGDDPYALLPAQSGVGRLIHATRVPVIPVFINGLTNSIPKQIAGNVTKRGEPVIVAFGAPIDFGDARNAAPSPRAYKRLADKTLEVIAKLGEEERDLRARL